MSLLIDEYDSVSPFGGSAKDYMEHLLQTVMDEQNTQKRPEVTTKITNVDE